MYLPRIVVVVTSAVLLSSGAAFGQFQPPPPYETDTGKKVYEALSGDIRREDERQRDDTRRPVKTLEFFGLRDDMTVLELFPGDGWYTALLGPVLAEKGKLYVAIGTWRLGDRLDKWVEKIGDGIELQRDESQPGFVFDLNNVDFAVTDVDLVLTFRNMHNLTKAARKALNQAVFQSLKPGGIYGVVDHTRRHMAPRTGETWRRADPVEIIKEVQDAGFELVDFSDLHYRPDDELEYDTTRPSIDRNSDRFTLKFRKPAP